MKKSVILGCILLLLCAIIAVAPALAKTETISPDADTSNFESIPDANCDTIHDYLYVYSRSGNMNRRSLVHFDVSSIPAGAKIESAILHLRIWSVKSDRTNNIHRVLGSWTEPDVTWNTQPVYASIPTDSHATGVTTGEWVNWDVTTDVQAFVEGTSNFGWLIKDPVESSDPLAYVKYYSREYVDETYRPYLEVSYTETEPAPVADFSGTPQSGDAPLTVQFTDASTGIPTSWSWDFDNDGIVDDTTQSPSYTYNSVGTYTVNLTVANAGGSDRKPKIDYITVNTAPVTSMTVKKSASKTTLPERGDVTYTYLVENTGTVSLTSVTLTDDKLGIIPGPASGDTNTNGILDTGEIWTYTATATLTTTTTNTAIASGNEPTGSPVSSQSNAVTVQVGAIPAPEFPTLAFPVMLTGAVGLLAVILIKKDG